MRQEILGPLDNAYDVHVVSAPEAAYIALFGLFIPQQPWQWASTIDGGLLIPEEEWLIETMDCHVYDPTGLNYHGRLIQFFAIRPAGQGPIFLPANNLQYGGGRATMNRQTRTTRGVGVLLRKPVVVATDQIQISVNYRKVRWTT